MSACARLPLPYVVKVSEVYDFTDPACRKAPEIPPEAFPEQFDPDKHVYGDYLQTVPHWRQAVYGNLEALRRCDLCLLLLPCGAKSGTRYSSNTCRGAACGKCLRCRTASNLGLALAMSGPALGGVYRIDGMVKLLLELGDVPRVPGRRRGFRPAQRRRR